MLPERYVLKSGKAMLGGFGVATKVRDSFLDRDVIFKCTQRQEDSSQIVNELRHISSSRSRHIVEIYDVVLDSAGQPLGIVMEYLPGRDYTDFWCHAGDDLNEYLKVLYQISSALADLHSLGVVHRDLKLENFKDSSAGILKLFDFGISTNDPNYHTVSSRATLGYAAPELFSQGVRITPAIDMYAFGACAWALASQYLPPALYQIPPQSRNLAPSLSSALKGLPSELFGLLDRCLSVNPKYRPSSSEVREMLSAHLVAGKHRGLFVVGRGDTYEINEINRSVTLLIGDHGSVSIGYDSLRFYVTGFSGSVYVNNLSVSIGQVLPDAAVIAFGPVSAGSNRAWVNFVSSRPEIVL